MTNWEERLKAYRAGTLTEAESQAVAEKLAELSALQDYLWEAEALDLSLIDEIKVDEKKLKQQVNRKFFKVVMLALAIIALVGGVIWFGLVPLVEKSYFDPRSTAKDTDVSEYSVYNSLYTEVTNPQFRLASTDVKKLGFADYEVTNTYSMKYGQAGLQETTKRYQVKKNAVFAKDGFSSISYLNSNVVPLFYPNEMSAEIEEMFAQDRLKKLATLKELPKSASVDGVLLFNESLTMTEVLKEFETEEGSQLHWFSLETGDPDDSQAGGGALGFDTFATIDLVYKDLDYAMSLNEDYPELFPTAFRFSREEMTEADYTTHVKSVLQYLIDQPAMMEKLASQMSTDVFKDGLRYIEENGLKINAVYVSGNTEVFQRLAAKESVWSLKVLGTELFSEVY